jgi:hypothetical protein
LHDPLQQPGGFGGILIAPTGGRDERPLRDNMWLRCTEPNPGSGRTARFTLHHIHKKERHRQSANTDNPASPTEKTGND